MDKRKYLKPEYGGYTRRPDIDPEGDYIATHHCGRSLCIKGRRIINKDILSCPCCYLLGPAFGWRIKKASKPISDKKE